MKALRFSLTASRKAAAPAFIVLFAFASLGAAWHQSGKVTICHIPPGNPSNSHTIEVSENALQAHLDHGDYVGSCKEPGEGAGDGIIKEEGVAYP